MNVHLVRVYIDPNSETMHDMRHKLSNFDLCGSLKWFYSDGDTLLEIYFLWYGILSANSEWTSI